MQEEVIPWWTPPVPGEPSKAQPLTWRDWWDALWGRLEPFYKVELDGTWCIVEANEVNDWLKPDLPDGESYTITRVQMTRRQFEALPEFDGF